MKKNNKSRKGFTIVELVIVIAVIAILAGVLIPTFSGVVTKANNSKALQEARNKYTEVYADEIADGTLANTSGTGYALTVDANGEVDEFTYTASNGIAVRFDGTEWHVPAN